MVGERRFIEFHRRRAGDRDRDAGNSRETRRRKRHQALPTLRDVEPLRRRVDFQCGGIGRRVAIECLHAAKGISHEERRTHALRREREVRRVELRDGAVHRIDEEDARITTRGDDPVAPAAERIDLRRQRTRIQLPHKLIERDRAVAVLLDERGLRPARVPATEIQRAAAQIRAGNLSRRRGDGGNDDWLRRIGEIEHFRAMRRRSNGEQRTARRNVAQRAFGRDRTQHGERNRIEHGDAATHRDETVAGSDHLLHAALNRHRCTRDRGPQLAERSLKYARGAESEIKPVAAVREREDAARRRHIANQLRTFEPAEIDERQTILPLCDEREAANDFHVERFARQTHRRARRQVLPARIDIHPRQITGVVSRVITPEPSAHDLTRGGPLCDRRHSRQPRLTRTAGELETLRGCRDQHPRAQCGQAVNRRQRVPHRPHVHLAVDPGIQPKPVDHGSDAGAIRHDHTVAL